MSCFQGGVRGNGSKWHGNASKWGTIRTAMVDFGEFPKFGKKVIFGQNWPGKPVDKGIMAC